MAAKPRFSALSDGTKEDWDMIVAEQRKFVAKLPERILAHLSLLGGDYGGFPVDRLQHSLQTAELAAAGGEDDEYVVCALLHDMGDTLGSTNHPDVAAAIIEPFVSPAHHWMVKHHGIFQGYNFFHHIGLDRNMRDGYRDSDHYDLTEVFIAKYDNPAFDSSKPKLDLALFAPMVRRVFAAPKRGIYKRDDVSS
ncbi:MAG: HD domain-containing protein [Proteobacteria bacterium]|nr:HD domain-containing protein [Pseudomonadota bacterium]